MRSEKNTYFQKKNVLSKTRTFKTRILKSRTLKSRTFSKTCTFQNYVLSKLRTFQSHRPCLQKYVLSKIRTFKNTYFQKYVLSKIRTFKITYFQKLRPFSSETRVFKAHSSYASILKCLSITGESLMFG